MGFRQPLSPDRLNRRVLLALEVFDPLGQEPVSRGLVVHAKGLKGEPIVNLTRRFVWLREEDSWPAEITVVPQGLPFEPATIHPPRPPQFPNDSAADRLLRIVLRPTSAANFPDGVTAIRGQLREERDPASAVVSNARVQLAWRDTDAGRWVPLPPATDADTATNRIGEFAAFLRVMPLATQAPDVNAKGLLVRLQFTRGGATRVTPGDFPFLADPEAKGRVVEGQLLARDLKLVWADLVNG